MVVSRTRLAYVDSLRALLAMLVVAHHAGQPYGPTGGRWPLTNPEHSYLLGPFFHVNASFLMGVFFLLAGYFMPAGFDRKGPHKFLKERFQRLGIPIVIFTLALFPFFEYLTQRGVSFWSYYWNRIVIEGNLDCAHLWFLAHLLLYASVYAVSRTMRPESQTRHPEPAAARPSPFPGNGRIFAYVAALALTSAVVRIRYPIDRWIGVPVPFEPAHLPQYLSLFIIGAIAYRRGWLEKLPDAKGRLWLGIAVAMVAFRYACAVSRLRFPGPLWNIWEALLATGMCIGLVWFFRDHVRWESGFQRFLGRNAYGVYLVHLPIVVIIQFGLRGSGFGPLALTAIVTAAGIAASLLVSEGLRRIPGAEKVL